MIKKYSSTRTPTTFDQDLDLNIVDFAYDISSQAGNVEFWGLAGRSWRNDMIYIFGKLLE